MAKSFEDLLGEGQAALRRGDAASARQVFAAALGEAASGDVLEGLARASYLELDFRAAIEGWQRAYTAHREADDRLGAARVARTIGYMYYAIVGDRSVASGWIARTQTLLAGTAASSESGWVSLNIGMFEGDRTRKEALFRDALEVARRFDDVGLELVALAYLGATLVHADQTEQGMELLDEALAAVAGDEVDDFAVIEEIFCQLFSACEAAHDVRRADEWIRVGEAIAERRRLPVVSAFCRTHYGGVLTAAGRWQEADVALTEAVRLWVLGQREFLRGGALIRLAQLRVRQERFEEAAGLLDGVDVDLDFVDAAPPLAGIHLARGQTALAQDVLERAIGMVGGHGTAVASLLALLVDVHLADQDVAAAEVAAGELGRCAVRHPSAYLTAIAALAQARVCVAGATGDPGTCLREALAAFSRAQMPVEVAQSRFELAGALRVVQPEVAAGEARAALEAFEELKLARRVDAAHALLRSLGVRTASTSRSGNVLTKREAEVLDLLGHGLSNPEISDRLYISRKTVEHHVGNVLAKLNLRSRAEAAAYAARVEPTTE